MPAVESLAGKVGVASACLSLDVPRSSFYRSRQPSREPAKRPRPSRALSDRERADVLSLLNSELYLDRSPAQVYASELDQNRYHCSLRTMYRILAENQQVKERRRQRRHPVYKKPELLATGPNQLWSWDITKLKGPEKGRYYALYVILDVFSRFCTGWMVATRESAALAIRLINDSIVTQGIPSGQLTVHADRGSSMKAKSLALFLADLGIRKSHSRPHVSNDNPYSESQFKTLKYSAEFPDRFGSLEDARMFCQGFFEQYNHHHYHSGIGLMTPASVHDGTAQEIQAQRGEVLRAARERHPERFVAGLPKQPPLPTAVWINKPVEDDSNQPAEAQARPGVSLLVTEVTTG